MSDQEGNFEPHEELQDLQKKFRNAESDRRAYAQESTANIQKQRFEDDNKC
jgi:hypothetical protein